MGRRLINRGTNRRYCIEGRRLINRRLLEDIVYVTYLRSRGKKPRWGES